MARRKRQFLDDDGSSSAGSDGDDEPHFDDNDPDARAERELFENPYGRKRRRKNGKEDAIYGVFGSDDEGDRYERPRAAKPTTKAPAFVSGGAKVRLDDPLSVPDDSDGDGDGADETAMGSDEEDAAADEDEDESVASEPEPSNPPSREEEEEPRPRLGGIGSGALKGGIGSSSFARGGIGTFQAASVASESEGQAGGLGLGASRGGIGSRSKGGIGASKVAATTPPEPFSRTPTPATEDLPTAFGAARAQRSFVRNAESSSSTPAAAKLSASERQHFSKISGTFGARMLAKMGWQAGVGLGTTGEGIVTPVESKLRPKGMGLAFKGFKEKTEQSKAEARRKGEIVSDDDDESKAAARKARKAAKAQAQKTDVWKKPKKTKTRVEHKSYEQIIAEAGAETVQSGIGQIIDATGATPREVASLADVSIASWTPTTDPTRLPEIRHNLRLITESCRSDLDGLAREARTLEERKRWIQNEDVRLRKKVEEEAELISRLQQMHLVVDEIHTQAREIASLYEASLDPFSASFDKLLGHYSVEIDKYRLDEVVVAAIAPVIRRMLSQWQPLEEPMAFTSNFRAWRRGLKMSAPEKVESQVQVYGSSTVISTVTSSEKPMTPYESLLWNAWLPRVRSSLNNDWLPEDPSPAVRLYEAWSPFLPPFIRDNFFDQLVLPKVHKAVGDWNPRKSKVPLQTLVFPWLPHVGLRLEDVLGDARRKVKSVIRSWTTAEAMPADLDVWQDVFDSGDWEAMMLKYVVPKLGSRLRDDFRVNPRQQDMQPLQDVLCWERLLRPTILSQILETEFFPKWLDVLHVWLVQPNPSFEEVSRWYSFWKGTFSENVQNMPGVAQGFTKGLQLMNTALELGPDAPTLLPRPDHRPQAVQSATSKAPARARPARTHEITFRSIAEEFAAAHNLLFVPTGRAHEKSRMPLYRVSPSADGKGGILVYIQDDAVWAEVDGEYRAIALEDVVLKATREGHA